MSESGDESRVSKWTNPIQLNPYVMCVTLIWESGHAKLTQAKFEGRFHTIPRQIGWKIENDV